MNSKLKNIILFIELSEEKWQCPVNIANIYLNRFTIDANAAFEIIGIHYLAKATEKLVHPLHAEYHNCADERAEKEKHDFDVIASGLETMASLRSKDVHIIIAAHLFNTESRAKMNKHILSISEKLKLSSVVISRVCMHKMGLVSMERSKEVYKDDAGFIIDRYKKQEDFDKMSFAEKQSHIRILWQW